MKKWLLIAGAVLGALLLYDLVFPPRMPAPEGASVDGTRYVVTRGRFGCPTGYVDHPLNPDWCALPAVAERLLSRARR